MSDSSRKLLGKRIKSERKARGLSQKSLALMVDVDRGWIIKIEKGEGNPSIEVVEKIATGLGLTMSELFKDI